MIRRAAIALMLSIHADLGERYVPFLRNSLRKVHSIFPTALTDLSLALVNDKRMGELHQEFMNLPGPTDVLTFPLDTNPNGQATCGEIVICVPYALRSARREGVPVQNELLLYAIHGILHLAGLDDRTAAQYKRMHRIEDDILASLGVGPVFHPGNSVLRRSRGKR
jgi:rRNA maturation RNase YbeY